MFHFLYFLIYLGCLIGGAWCVSEGGDILGEKYDASVVGGIILSGLNTLPETIFFISALSSNQPTFAMGAISGSVIVVCTVAVGLCVVIGSNARHKDSNQITLFPKVKQQSRFLMYSLVFVLSTLLFGFQMLICIGGVLGFTSFIMYTLLSKKDEAHGHHEEHEDEEEEEQPTYKGVLYLVVGGVLIYVFSDPFIQSVVLIGKSLGITPLTLAFFFAPIASEAPEILESISLSRQGKLQNINIAFSNLVGGTISKTTLLTGILSFYGYNREFEWLSPAYTLSLFLVLTCAGAVSSFGFGDKFRAIHGYALLSLFIMSCLTQFSIAWFFGSGSVLQSAELE
ncbi:hypothetical protein C9374_010111 [Naegleria lovaniensis]|uniref:Sodium/calcium exchanger membrane region domain-containing protein n=1 Tax=Naegleria lovaniensis TaxID=51637 RepID=A0AA88GCK7_NAELO|nr:uncharacterized protein C9374_010111 [Naegleria lovaniensis]KAG2375107.1 hypothetical protein C9374_010111 [Naegleria lovaniensis]